MRVDDSISIGKTVEGTKVTSLPDLSMQNSGRASHNHAVVFRNQRAPSKANSSKTASKLGRKTFTLSFGRIGVTFSNFADHSSWG